MMAIAFLLVRVDVVVNRQAIANQNSAVVQPQDLGENVASSPLGDPINGGLLVGQDQ